MKKSLLALVACIAAGALWAATPSVDSPQSSGSQIYASNTDTGQAAAVQKDVVNKFGDIGVMKIKTDTKIGGIDYSLATIGGTGVRLGSVGRVGLRTLNYTYDLDAGAGGLYYAFYRLGGLKPVGASHDT